jgi:RNA polymerase sigma factor (sigma-70 family)
MMKRQINLGGCQMVRVEARVSSGSSELLDGNRQALCRQPIGKTERTELLRRLTKLTRNSDVAEDCLQSAFARVEEYRRHTRVDNELGLLARVARNIAIDEARKARVRTGAGCVSELPEHYRDCRPLPDEVLMVRERLSRAHAILNQLPDRTRTVFLMHRFSRMKYREIAVELDISVSAVEKHIARASLALANGVDQENTGSDR